MKKEKSQPQNFEMVKLFNGKTFDPLRIDMWKDCSPLSLVTRKSNG